MKCPECNNKTNVIDVRISKGEKRRRRECTECGYRFTTFESIEGQASYDEGWNDAISMLTGYAEKRKV